MSFEFSTPQGLGMVVIGGGQAGGRAAQTLREEGWRGPVTLVGLEDRAPYERPPLSKAVLAGKKTVDECALFHGDFFRDNNVGLRLGNPVRAIRRDAHEVMLADGERLPYHRLLVATGAEPRRLRLAGLNRDGVFYLRTGDDADRLARRLVAGSAVVIVGGGFIGLEVAAAASLRGCRVVVVEAGPRLVMRAVPEQVEPHLAARHRQAGVDIRVGRQIAAVQGDKAVASVTLDDGTAIECQVLLIGIGVEPRVELAREAGLAIDNGIAVDVALRTSDPSIFAAGDVCSFPYGGPGALVRLESWKGADEQGRLAARNMLGKGEPYTAVPWFWSDQYELTIQVAGLIHLGRRSVERRIDHDTLVVFHLADDGRIVAASGIGHYGPVGRNVRLGQIMIEQGIVPDQERLADPSVNLKLLLTAEAA